MACGLWSSIYRVPQKYRSHITSKLNAGSLPKLSVGDVFVVCCVTNILPVFVCMIFF